MCMSVCLHASAFECVPGAQGGQRRVLGTLELEFYSAAATRWVRGIEPVSSARAATALNHHSSIILGLFLKCFFFFNYIPFCVCTCVHACVRAWVCECVPVGVRDNLRDKRPPSTMRLSEKHFYPLTLVRTQNT